MEEKIAAHPQNGNYFLGKKLLILTGVNEVAFLNNDLVTHRQKLEPRSMEVLQLLLEGKGQVVSREQIIDRIWGDYGGGEEGLIQAVSKLRRAFRDEARSPRVIETIPKKGYRLLLPVREAGNGAFEEKNENTGNERRDTVRERPHSPIIIQQAGLFTGFINRLTEPKFLLAFLVFSVVLIMVLGILSYMLFWGSVAMGWI